MWASTGSTPPSLCGRDLEDFIAFKEATSANPDLVKRIRLDASLNEQRPEGYYGSFPVGYTDGPFLKPRAAEVASNTGTEQTYA